MKPPSVSLKSVTLLITVASLGYLLFFYLLKSDYQNSFGQIKVGDSKRRVIELYGRPSEVSDCSEFRRPSSIDEIRKNCTEVYWYRSPMQQWIFFFDNNDQVVHKAYNVSY